MGVVDEHREPLALVDRLEAPRHLSGAFDRLDDTGPGNAQLARRRERPEHVVDVEPPSERSAELCRAVGALDDEARTVEAGLHLGRAVSGVVVERERHRP